MNISQSKSDGTFSATIENTNVLGSTKNYVEPLNNHAVKSMFEPFSSLGTNSDFNPNWDKIGKEYQKKAEQQMEATQKMTSSLVEACQKQLKSSVEIGKKIQEEFTSQVKRVYELNQQFWVDVYNTSKHISTSENAKNEIITNNKK